MRIIPTLSWRLDTDSSDAIDGRLLPLLEAIAASGSLAAAVVDCGMSYRAAWGLLREYQRKLDIPLVRLERGRGARLAPAGERFVLAHRVATRRLVRVHAGLSAELGTAAVARSRLPMAKLRVAASHDLALVSLRDELPEAARLRLGISFMGSLNALQEFGEGKAEMAVNYSLEPWEIDAGFILTCQAHPLTERVTIDYDQM